MARTGANDGRSSRRNLTAEPSSALPSAGQGKAPSGSSGTSKTDPRLSILRSSMSLPLPLLDALSHRSGIVDEITRQSLDRFQAGLKISGWVTRRARARAGKKETKVCGSAPSPTSSATTAKAGLTSAPKPVTSVNRNASHKANTQGSKKSTTPSKQGPPKRAKKGHAGRGRTQRTKTSSVAAPSGGDHGIAPKARNEIPHTTGMMTTTSHHWLVQGLLSPCSSHRNVVTRILMNGCDVTEHRRWQLVQLFFTIMETNPEVDPTVSIQWLAIIKHIIHLDADFCLALGHQRRFGLSWLCDMIWRLAVHLDDDDGGRQRGRLRHLHKQESVDHDGLLLAYVDLVHSMLLRSTEIVRSDTVGPKDDERSKLHTLKVLHGELWDDRRSSQSLSESVQSLSSLTADGGRVGDGGGRLSPLACLIGTYHLLQARCIDRNRLSSTSVRTQPNQQTESNASAMWISPLTDCIDVLKTLVDPKQSPSVTRIRHRSEGKPGILSSGSQASSSKRLVDTFLSTTSPAQEKMPSAAESASLRAQRILQSKRRRRQQQRHRLRQQLQQQRDSQTGSTANAVARLFSAMYRNSSLDPRNNEGLEDNDDGDDDDDDVRFDDGLLRDAMFGMQPRKGHDDDEDEDDDVEHTRELHSDEDDDDEDDEEDEDEEDDDDDDDDDDDGNDQNNDSNDHIHTLIDELDSDNEDDEDDDDNDNDLDGEQEQEQEEGNSRNNGNADMIGNDGSSHDDAGIILRDILMGADLQVASNRANAGNIRSREGDDAKGNDGDRNRNTANASTNSEGHGGNDMEHGGDDTGVDVDAELDSDDHDIDNDHDENDEDDDMDDDMDDDIHDDMDDDEDDEDDEDDGEEEDHEHDVDIMDKDEGIESLECDVHHDDDDDEEDDDDDGEVDVHVHGSDHDIIINDEDNEDDEIGVDTNGDVDDMVQLGQPQLLGMPSSTHAGIGGGDESSHTRIAAENVDSKKTADRKEAYISACMQVLKSHRTLGIAVRKEMLVSIMTIVKPQKKPINAKIVLRRAPTQEEFFRGNLSQNPVSLNMLSKKCSATVDGETAEPTVRELRQHIANDLQMGDSAELIELLVANKILDLDLKLRVVNQVVWKNFLMENSQSNPSSILAGLNSRSGSSFLSAGSGGLSMIFTSNWPGSGSGRQSRSEVSASTPISALPPMVVTYRLTGVDGEATEDTVQTLKDPDKVDDAATPEEAERLLENQYGITRLVTAESGIFVVLRAVEDYITDTVKRIRRDDVGLDQKSSNVSRISFKASSPHAGLSLLWCCSRLQGNRNLLLQCRAPTILLRLLLDVLHALEDGHSQVESENNATAKMLQEMIEVLATDISTVDAATSSTTTDEIVEDSERDASTLRLVLSSIKNTLLGRPLRNIIAKLLPYLTYGSPALCRELASQFARNVDVDCLSVVGTASHATESNQSVMMETFVHTTVSLPANEVCHALRVALVECGMLANVASVLIKHIPIEPPPWSPSLWGKDQKPSGNQRAALQCDWRNYLNRRGINVALNMLIGLAKHHPPTQNVIATYKNPTGTVSLLQICHWLEATSDNQAAKVSMNGLGLTAETLLDELSKGNEFATNKIKKLRQKTRNRKKEIAMERRKSLFKKSSFGSGGGTPTRNSSGGGGRVGGGDGDGDSRMSRSPGSGVSPHTSSAASQPSDAAVNAAVSLSADSPTQAAGMGTASSPSGGTDATTGEADAESPSEPGSDAASTRSKKRRKLATPDVDANANTKPDWMLEMENMEDETGLTCAVCQEGRTLQPTELLGLYAYIKKVSIPSNQCGSRESIDGTTLMAAFPKTMPEELEDSHAGMEWYPAAKAASQDILRSSKSEGLFSSSISSSRRSNHFVTTVSAGNAIHMSCHSKARHADRNHPKAPKSEWEGASLRNSRVNCNVILPLVSSKVPLVAVDVGLTDHQTAISNLLGARPKSMLWQVLHDVRLLLLRVAHGESLSVDCEGGSLASNIQLVFYQLFMADMFDKDAQIDDPKTSQHARVLSAGLLAAKSMRQSGQSGKAACSPSPLTRGVADSAPMAALTCILFHNESPDLGSIDKLGTEESKPSPKRRWVVGKDLFLRSLINCAGRRHALGIAGSGCASGRNTPSRNRSNSFADWDYLDDDDDDNDDGGGNSRSSRGSGSDSERQRKRSNNSSALSGADVDDFGAALRPMLTYYAIINAMSEEYVLNLEDARIDEAASRIVQTVEVCHRAANIHELLEKAEITLSHKAIIDEFQLGMVCA